MTPEQLALARKAVQGICPHANAKRSDLNGDWFYCRDCHGHFQTMPAESLLALALAGLDATIRTDEELARLADRFIELTEVVDPNTGRTQDVLFFLQRIGMDLVYRVEVGRATSLRARHKVLRDILVHAMKTALPAEPPSAPSDERPSVWARLMRG